MKWIVLSLILTNNVAGHASPLINVEVNQEDLVLHDLEQIHNHGKKWQSKLEKATTAIMPESNREDHNEG